ncbi:MAG: protease SohB [Gammaproteobacteria bacterium]|nr:protease SohB [Gammaproteobacteria bacterium]MBQ0838956.1 protease SohB [Gammaproteobacteria bacterium]
MEFLSEYGLFLAKAATVVIAVAIVAGILASLGQKGKKHEKGHIEVVSFNETISTMTDVLADVVVPADTRKAALKAEKKSHKAEQKAEKKALKSAAAPLVKKRVFVLDFHGDLRASAVDSFREEITTVLAQASSKDEVVVRLESGGGMVPGYGLAASQLDRIKKKGVPLTICIDKVAASGGYMMACVADQILAAPFAVIGSIGVVAQVPNVHRLLKKHDVDIELMTAGKYKRTLTMLGENTDEGREKFREELEDTHELFKAFVGEHRTGLDIEAIATGEVWYGAPAVKKGLVDDTKTSDEYLTGQLDSADIYTVTYAHKKSLPEKFGFALESSGDRFLMRWLQRLTGPAPLA